MDLEQHLLRQIAFSRATFGPGPRTAGVIDHIRKELAEIANAETSEERVKEWTDVVILALDGLWRELVFGLNEDHEGAAAEACGSILHKQGKNELRTWPDWRGMPQDRAIEHVRGSHD